MGWSVSSHPPAPAEQSLLVPSGWANSAKCVFNGSASLSTYTKAGISYSVCQGKEVWARTDCWISWTEGV